MSDFTLWLIGMGTSVAVIIAAVISFLVWSYLQRRIPLATRLVTLQQDVAHLESKRDMLTDELKDLAQRKAEREMVIAELSEADERLRKTQDQLLQVEPMRMEFEKVKQQLGETQENLRIAQAEWLKVAEKEADVRRECEKLQRETTELKHEKDDTSKAIRALKEQEDTLRAEITKLQAKHAELSARLPSLQAEVDRQKSALSTLRDDLRRAETEKLEATKARDELRNAREVIKTDLDRLGQRVDSLKSQEKVLQSNLHGLEARHAKLSADVPALQNEYDRLHKGLETLRKELDRAEAEKREAEKMRDTALSTAETLEHQIKQKKTLIDATQKTLDAIAEKMKDFGQIPTVPVKEKLEDLMLPVLKLDAVGDRRRDRADEGSEQKAFADLQTHILKSGFTYHERALLAFHTSLKTADISPLVVLAGVSGTGKSQLPRLYAEAMGMHFLNVAVQPRWDSPQDMFGFFNYMENRYKATELGRALRQMDFRNWEEEDQSLQKVQEGMLLVLLDEMNLARIEYYFSELLSRLEMRNAVRASTDEAMRLASIPLQLGSLQEGESSQYLYVGSNVLFVGTMNEDETTQALSPKVMDRANVLRFGKPEKTRGSRNDERQTRGEPTGYLVYEDWSGWNRPDLPQADKQRLEKVCGRLNAALQLIHRPFGHRVHQAMESYMANYPTWTDAPFNHALADQLEQKIIPKLRGISRDTDDHAGDVYDAISLVINEIEDGELLKAFSEASEAPVFEWHGVNRPEREY
ncbi:MAG TPA: AAA family ATPase [Planctomycetota bacterium]|nr:AAA family ATPase [Planctomycetota bacterium]